MTESNLQADLYRPVSSVLELRGVSCAYDVGHPAVRDIAFAAHEGEILCLLGPSGCGKTTILRAIAGFEPVRSGQIFLSGELVSSPEHMVPTEDRHVGMVFQEYALFPHLSALGNVMTALGHRPSAERRSRAEELLRLVHLSDHQDRRPHQLSGGERQRVALARALARAPAVLLLDEPFAAVDRTVRRRLQDEIDELRRTLDIPLLLVTHDFDDVVRLATHLLILDHGRAIASGALADLTSRPDLPWLRDAVGLGSVFEASAVRRDPEHGLLALTFDGGTLLASDREISAGTKVRVRIAARDVILATSAPDGLSLHNVLPGTVSAVNDDPALDSVVVQIAIEGVRLLAEVTRDAIGRLGIGVGTPLFALIKSVSIEILADFRQI